MNSMYMNTDEMKTLVSKLNDKINSLNSINEELKSKCTEIDGSSDSWKGDNQELFYGYLKQILDYLPKDIEKLKEYHTFLNETVENYEQRDKDISKDIDNLEERLDVE